jgi:hypothetical protein
MHENYQNSLVNDVNTQPKMSEFSGEPNQEKGYFQRFCPCLHPTALAPLFDLSTADMKVRLLASLMPFNQKFI